VILDQEPSMAPDDRSNEPTATPLRWPPPGLERMQGDLYVIAARAALAGALLVLPMLFVVAREQDFATFGPFADAWWVPIVLTTVGLGFALDALARLARTLRRTSHALTRGYTTETLLCVLADVQNDMGFLLSGARHFSVVDQRERVAVAWLRVTAGLLLASAGMWLLLAMSIGLLLSPRGLLAPATLVGLTLLPAAAGYVGGGVATLVQQSRVRRARRRWHEQPWADDLDAGEVRAWQESAPLTATDGGGTPPGRDPLLRPAAAGVLFTALLVTLPVLTLVPSSAIAPVLTTISMPTYDSYRSRAARAEAYRSYVVEGDPAISAAEAGRLLQDLMFVGELEGRPPSERAPSTRFERAWFPDGLDAANPTGMPAYAWPDSLIERVGRGVDPGVVSYLREVTDHPASALLSTLARATALDAASARWETPFPQGMRMATLPIPRFRPLRDAAKVQVAAAAVALAEGRRADAERALRELISVGFLLGDEGPTLLDNIVGYSLIEEGGAALGDLFRVTGRAGDAAVLSRLSQVAERAGQLATMEYARGPEAFVRSLPGMVMDTTLMRGLRWEYFINLATMAPCLNVHRMVFGADEAFNQFVEEARTSLVQWPSEEALFDLARRGWVGGVDPAEATVVGWLTGLYMSHEENSCAQFVRHMQAEELF
jgi:hypothetical protein